jgi:hypothetical protein
MSFQNHNHPPACCNPPIPSDDPTREVVILALVIALVGLGVIILTQAQSCGVAVALVMVGAYAIVLRQYPEIGQANAQK